ncbi:28S ribosomal protein S9, mitochondrial [Scomber scombrus]|uniref:28S ribosomal protein S9, mitochondrial n=1 Tax=Scomber scombrus TaxID=13677 RepID=UPI002DD8651F|nr:28S ribosomal protein S9, mitochondrial [Scomber scombrus]
MVRDRDRGRSVLRGLSVTSPAAARRPAASSGQPSQQAVGSGSSYQGDSMSAQAHSAAEGNPRHLGSALFRRLRPLWETLRSQIQILFLSDGPGKGWQLRLQAPCLLNLLVQQKQPQQQAASSSIGSGPFSLTRDSDVKQLPPVTFPLSAKMAAPGVRTVGRVSSFLGKCGNCSSSINTVTSQLSRQVLSRRICVSSALHRKNLAAAGPEKFSVEYIQKQVEEYNIGKRHLANMMGEDPDNFSQEDIDRSITYLFPSGLFEKKARPIMKHPDEIFPRQRAIQWGEDRRPFHFLFYTGKQAYYTLMHELFGKILNIEKHQDRLRAKGLFSKDVKQITLGTSRWLLKEELDVLLVETISADDYNRFIQLMERLLSLPYSATEEEFVLRYRQQLEAQSRKQMVPQLEKDERGVAFSTSEGRRKTSNSSVVLRDSGSGRITVNGQEYLHYFSVLQDREQLMFPLQFMGMLGRFDLECTVSGGGRSSQAGALRLAISQALLSFLSEGEIENMRQAGLLTPDPRVRERKKPGQEGARKKFTWKKR